MKETYAINEIAFCHTDPSFQRIVVWVVRKKRSQRLSPSGADTSSGLEAIVFECSSEENMKKLCQSFHETSRRVKLEQYRHPHRRKDTSPTASRTRSSNTSSNSTLTPESIIKALKEASQRSPTLIATVKPVTTPIHLPKTRIPSNGSGPGSEVEVLSTVAGTRFNLVQRTDGDGVTHIEVSRGLPVENPVENLITLDDDQSLGGPSSIISISTPDVGNLLATNTNTGNKSRFCKEIEGIIRSDVDVGGTRKETMQRQRQPAILVVNSGNGEDDSGGELRKVWSPPQSTCVPEASTEDGERDKHSSEPPQRPERKKYIRRNKAPAPQPPPMSSQVTKGPQQLESVNNTKLPLTLIQSDTNKTVMPQRRVNNSNQQMVVKGQFIRVSVDQKPQPTMVVPVTQQGTWIYGNNISTAYSPALPTWGVHVTATHKSSSNKAHIKRKDVEDSVLNSSTAYQYHSQQQNEEPQGQQHYRKNRSRSRNFMNGSHRSKSPPARRPMAYRYIDTVPASNTANSLSNRFFGLSQKLREIGGAVVNSSSSTSLPHSGTTRRRNSIGELPARLEYLGEGYGGATEGKNEGNLKSVIKKNRRIGEYTEPKKVTFSAYATVQVVD
jgi:hypothetical protein